MEVGVRYGTNRASTEPAHAPGLTPNLPATTPAAKARHAAAEKASSPLDSRGVRSRTSTRAAADLTWTQSASS